MIWRTVISCTTERSSCRNTEIVMVTVRGSRKALFAVTVVTWQATENKCSSNAGGEKFLFGKNISSKNPFCRESRSLTFVFSFELPLLRVCNRRRKEGEGGEKFFHVFLWLDFAEIQLTRANPDRAQARFPKPSLRSDWWQTKYIELSHQDALAEPNIQLRACWFNTPDYFTAPAFYLGSSSWSMAHPRCLPGPLPITNLCFCHSFRRFRSWLPSIPAKTDHQAHSVYDTEYENTTSREGGTSYIVKTKSFGEDPRATGGLLCHLPHPRVNKTIYI